MNECFVKEPCQNNGTCFNNEGSYDCSCSVGWEGKHCDIGKVFVAHKELMTTMESFQFQLAIFVCFIIESRGLYFIDLIVYHIMNRDCVFYFVVYYNLRVRGSHEIHEN